MYRPRPCLSTFHTKEGAQLLHISIMNHNTQIEKQCFDITWHTVPSQK